MILGRLARSSWFDRLARLRVDGSLDELGQGVAEFLNWASGHRGYLAQAGVWFQPPLYVEHRSRGAAVNHVNERIVELAFAFKAVSDLKPAARVLDIGSAESTLALSLASCGFKTVALDPRGYPIHHPDMQIVAEDVLKWSGPADAFDAIFCISTLEHIGLGSYDQGAIPAAGVDRAVLDRCSQWMGDDGYLILTVPWGVGGDDGFQRTYDARMLEELLVAWDVVEKSVVLREGPVVWRRANLETEQGGSGVVMIRATPRDVRSAL